MSFSFVVTQHLGIEGGGEIRDGCMWGDLCDMIRAVGTIYAHEDEFARACRRSGFVGMMCFSACAFPSCDIGDDRRVIGCS